MTDSMVERVAQRLYESSLVAPRDPAVAVPDRIPPEWSRLGRYQREFWLYEARAAIEAMKVFTP